MFEIGRGRAIRAHLGAMVERLNIENGHDVSDDDDVRTSTPDIFVFCVPNAPSIFMDSSPLLPSMTENSSIGRISRSLKGHKPGCSSQDAIDVEQDYPTRLSKLRNEKEM